MVLIYLCRPYLLHDPALAFSVLVTTVSLWFSITATFALHWIFCKALSSRDARHHFLNLLNGPISERSSSFIHNCPATDSPVILYSLTHSSLSSCYSSYTTWYNWDHLLKVIIHLLKYQKRKLHMTLFLFERHCLPEPQHHIHAFERYTSQTISYFKFTHYKVEKFQSFILLSKVKLYQTFLT